jgi:hypothetical protein
MTIAGASSRLAALPGAANWRRTRDIPAGISSVVVEQAISVLLFVPVMVVTVLVFAAVIRRLLGVRVGAIRTLLAAALALMATSPILAALAPPDPTTMGGGEAFLLLTTGQADGGAGGRRGRNRRDGGQLHDALRHRRCHRGTNQQNLTRSGWQAGSRG